MSPILTPLFAVLAMMILGSLVQKLRLLPPDTDMVLNQYVYYVAFPAIMLIALAQTPIDEILQWGFIAGYSLAMLITYLLVMLVSHITNKGRADLAALRALNTTFGNTAFIGIPLLSMLFPGQQSALAAAAIASLLSVIVFALVLVVIELYQEKRKGKQGKKQSALLIIILSLIKNPVVIGSAIGVLLSAFKFELFEPLSIMLKQIGMTSSPCALFAIGMVLAKASGSQDSYNMKSSVFNQIIELSWINFAKLFIQPALAYILLSAFGIKGDYFVMGVLLASLPTAASVYLLAERYQIKVMISAQAIMLGTILSIVTLPLIDQFLH
ncbi:AEC family transporter [Shewanella sp. D64]|uniref:AEC family transporter n=1 Tax=unclassified Shewanella TaxID=196818 RepID=UPI0022BA41B9|nr:MULTISPECIES: AEC family transporter [unclassified Shewanella]MEC4728446.1 AEC family transporter [Shewanella sp. D64]MEC4740456.1 AEC family transporter [Shewanella sp. E94]WBJ94016.1 AEC family transporter [Shewanella sp. MTB7]